MSTRHQLFLEMIHQLYNTDLKQLAKDAEVSISTLYNWTYGTTISPRSDTLFRVAAALGYKIEWKRSRSIGRRKAA